MDALRFLLGDELVTLPAVDPTTTVLEWLRAQRRTGTKEGCAEGDCGACTVVLGEPAGDAVRYRAVNACIHFLPELAGKQILTVEHLAAPAGDLHPVQRGLIDRHASQCGFCTPGFAMSLFALFHQRTGGDEAIYDALAGNLCRCTGYRPIVDAARDALGAAGPGDRFSRAAPATAARLRDIGSARSLAVEAVGTRYWAPQRLAELEELLKAHPEATLLAGGTDVGLWVTKQHRRLDEIISVNRVAELGQIVETRDLLEIGAAATYTQILPLLARRWPSFGEMLRRLGSTQIRNAGTMGGNVANGSPIGDSMPALMALDARLVLNRFGVRREVALDAFYLDYRKTALARGEFLERIVVPHHPGWRFAVYKISKRQEQDIAAVTAGISVRLQDGVIADARLAFGGMAAIPLRARKVEAALRDRPWSLETVHAAAQCLEEDCQPISDMRASAGYRLQVARNLLTRFYLEGEGRPVRLGQVAHG